MLRKMNRQNSTRKEAMLQALRKTLGIVSTAARLAEIDRTTHYLWMKEDPDYAKAVRELDDYVIDYGEGKLFGLMEADNPQAILFFMKTRGKNRGYTERTEIEVTERKPLSWITKKEPEE